MLRAVPWMILMAPFQIGRIQVGQFLLRDLADLSLTDLSDLILLRHARSLDDARRPS